MWVVRHSIVDRIVSGLWFCRRSWRLKIVFGRTFVHIWKSYIRSSKLDVQETNISHTQLNEIISLDAGLRMGEIPALDLWDLVIDVFNSSPDQLKKSKERVRETCCVTLHQTSTPKTKARLQSSPTFLCWAMLIMFRQTRSVLNSVRCSTFLKITKQWLGWSSKAEVQQWDTYPEPQSCSWLVVWQNQSGSEDSNQVRWHQTPTRRHIDKREISHVMSGTIFSNCLTSAISAQFAALRISAPPAARKRWQKRMQEETGVDRTPTHTTHLCTYSASQNAPHRCFTHANTRGSSRLPWCVKSSLSSQLHVSHVAALATEHFYTIFLTNIFFRPSSLSMTCFILAHSGLEHETLRDPRRIHEICISHRLWAQIDTIWRFRASRNWVGQKYWERSTASKNWARQEYWDRSVSNTRKNTGRPTINIPSQKKRRRLGNFDVDMPYVQSRIHSDFDSAESIADSDLEDGELRKMLASPLYASGWGENYGSPQRPIASGKPEAQRIQKRGASANRIQADHCRRERELEIKFISRATSVWETGCIVFIKERRTGKSVRKFWCSNVLIPNWEDLFLKVIKITCSVRQDLNWWSKNKLDVSTVVSMSFSNKLMLEDWNCKTLIMDMSNLEENKARLQEESSMKEQTSPRWSNTKNSWIGWDEESSRTTSWRILSTEIKRKSRGNTETHFTIAVNARTKEVYERFRWIPGSGIES